MKKSIKLTIWSSFALFLMSCLLFNIENPLLKNEDTSSMDIVTPRVSDVQETLLYEISGCDMYMPGMWLKVSPDGRRFAFPVKYSNGKEAFIVDGVGSAYDEVPAGIFSFSQDSQHYVYLAKDGGKEFIVYDGKEGKRYDQVSLGLHPYLSFNPEQFLYTASENGQSFCVIDNQESERFNADLDDIVCTRSPDGQRLAIKVDLGEGYSKRYFMVVDGIEEQKYEYIDEWIGFSADSKQYAYWAFNGNQMDIVINGKVFPYEKSFVIFAFSPDGKRYAFKVDQGEQITLVVDGEEIITPYESVYNLQFSPDGSHLHYVASSEGNEFVVIDGEEQEKFSGVSWSMSSPKFSPDSQHIAYVLCDKGKYSYICEEGNQSVILDGLESESHKDILYFKFSPDSQRVGYLVQINDRIKLVWDDGESKLYDDTGRGDLGSGGGGFEFSPDSQKITFIGIDHGRNNDKMYVVVDGIEGQAFEYIKGIAFSPDSKYLTYGVYHDGMYFIMVDDTKGKTYDGIFIPDEGLVFDSANQFHYLAVSSTGECTGNIYLVEETLE